MRKRKICVVTGTRAEYGLLYWLMKEIKQSRKLDLQLIVTGTHLVNDYGYTIQEIKSDGFKINKEINMMLASDDPVSITKSMGLALMSFSEAFSQMKPDILLILGDRYEVFAAASAAMVSQIPIAHIHGGEATEGLIDEAIRHSITKMSHLHFTAADKYKERVIQLGEQSESVFCTGGMAIESIKNLSLLSKKELEEDLNFKFGKKNLLVTFHPVTLEDNSSKKQFSNLLESLSILEDTKIIFTKSNADTYGKVINAMIDRFVQNNKERSIAFSSLGQLRYLSCLKFVDAIVGNSSSGLLEAPSFKIATVNIGDRQRGRLRPDSVIDCDISSQSINKSINKVYSKDFKKVLSAVKNPLDKGKASKKIRRILENTSIENILKKKFRDMD